MANGLVLVERDTQNCNLSQLASPMNTLIAPQSPILRPKRLKFPDWSAIAATLPSNAHNAPAAAIAPRGRAMYSYWSRLHHGELTVKCGTGPGRHAFAGTVPCGDRMSLQAHANKPLDGKKQLLDCRACTAEENDLGLRTPPERQHHGKKEAGLDFHHHDRKILRTSPRWC